MMFDHEKYTPHHDWYKSVYDMAKEAARIIGIDISDIYYSGFWSQGDGASFTGSYAYAKGAATAIRKEYPAATELHAIADTLQRVQRTNFYGLYAAISQSGHYVHEMTMRADVGGANGQDATSDAEEAVTEAMRDFARWIYDALEKEYEYQSAWEMARRWQDLAETAKEERASPRQLIKQIREAAKGYCQSIHPVICNALRGAIRRHLETMQEALEERREIVSNFHYWDDGKRVDLEEFAAANL